MMKRRLINVLLWPALALLLAAAPLAVEAQTPTGPSVPVPPTNPSAAGSLRFMRIYVPESQIGGVPRDDGKYAPPIDQAEFERLLKAAESGATGPPAVSTGAQIDFAQYAARVDGDRLVGETATLQVRHLAAEPTLKWLEGCRLAVSDPRWEGPKAEPAQWGLAPDGRQVLLVDRTGAVSFRWSLAGTRDAAGLLSFTLNLPPSTTSQLVLDLPPDLMPSTSAGLVAGPVDAPRAAGSGAPELARWHIHLPARASTQLRIIPRGTSLERRQLVLLRQSVTYDFTPRGVELAAQFTLDVLSEPLRQLVLELDPLDAVPQFTAARYGNFDLPWTLTQDLKTKVSRVVLELPEPIQGTDRVVRIGALVPLSTGMNWKLPTLRVQGTFWQGESAQLLVREPLSLERLTIAGGRQTRAVPLAGASPGQEVSVQYFQPDAKVEVLVDRVPERVELTSGTTIQLEPSRTSGRMVCDFRAAKGDRFVFEADVPPTWNIDGVEAASSISATEVAPDLLEDWTLQSGGTKSHLLTVRLRQALSPSRGVRLTIHGHRRSAALDEQTSVEQFQLATFRDVSPMRQIMSASVVPPYQLRLSGDSELQRLDPRNLDPRDLELMAGRPSPLVFVLGDPASDLRLEMRSEGVAYSAEVEVDATLEGSLLAESYVVRCNPQTAHVERLRVRFSKSRRAPLEWSLEDAPQDSFTAVRLARALNTIGPALGLDDETWEITLRHPREIPFTLRAQRSSEAAGSEVNVALASIPDAITQRGMVTIRTVRDEPIEVRTLRVKTVPAEMLPIDRYSNTRAVYRYEPAAAEPAVVISRQGVRPDAAAWAWALTLESRLDLSGMMLHEATYRLQNNGQRELELHLPEGAQINQVLVDGQELVEIAPQGGRSIVVPLPAGERYPSLCVSFQTARPPPQALDYLTVPAVAINLPVLGTHWRVWLPPNYDFQQPGTAGADLEQKDWIRRLLGSLRSDSRRPFDFFASQDWRGLWQPPPSGADVMLRADPLLESLGASRVSWGELLADWTAPLIDGQVAADSAPTSSLSDQRPGDKPPTGRVLIDALAVASEGITPDAPIRTVAGDTSRERGLARLARSNLVVLVRGPVLLLTTARVAATYGRQLSPVAEGRNVAEIRDGPLATEIEAALTGGTRLLTVDAWIAPSEQHPASWTLTPRSSYAALGDAGWTVSELEIIPESSPRVGFYHRPTVMALGWAAFLLSAALCWWLLVDRPQGLVLAIGAAAGMTMWAPEALIPCARGMFWGTLAGGLFWLLRPVRIAAPTWENPPTTGRGRLRVVSPAALWIAGFVALIGMAVAAWAQEGAPAVTKAASKIYRVLMPVDSQLKPTGKCYLPEEFYLDLQKRAGAGQPALPPWLLRSADYQVVLDRSLNTAQMEVTQLGAEYSIEVFQAGQVRVPIKSEGVILLDDGARLDDVPVSVNWDLGSESLSLMIDEPGIHRLHLDLRPVVRSQGDSAGFDLTIPRVCQSQATLIVKADAQAIRVPSAAGGVWLDLAAGQLKADLGPADLFSVRWPAEAGSMPVTSGVEVQELYWLKVYPGSVVLDAHFNFQIQGQIRQVRLDADARLRLLPFTPDQPIKGRLTVQSGDSQTFILDLNEPTTGPLALRASFLLVGASDVGNLLLPRLRAQADRRQAGMLALSIDPALSYETGGTLVPEDASEFLSLWGADPARPEVAYRTPVADPVDWKLTTQPRQPKTTAKQLLWLALDRDHVELQYDGELNTTAGYAFQYVLRAPKDLAVESVSLRKLLDGSEQAARWSQEMGTDDSRVTVFLNGPVSDRQQLMLRGRLPVRIPAKLTLPHVRLEAAQVDSSGFRIYRRPPVLVKLSKGTGLQVVAEMDEQETAWGRPVAWLEAIAADATTILQIAPNKPAVSATQVTSLRRAADAWSVEVDYDLSVLGGVVDALRFDIPAQWDESLVVEPPTSYRLVDVPGENRRQLILRPSQAIAGDYHLRIRVPRAISPRERVHVPEVMPRDVTSLKRFVVVPTKFEAQPVEWETSHLNPVPLTEVLGGHGGDSVGVAAYQVTDRGFQAALQSVRRVAGTPQVRLADIHVAWRSDGRCHGTASFDLEPAGLRSCSLSIPSSYRLVHVEVAGLPAELNEIGPGRWRLGLGPEQLPQRIEVVFAGTLPPADAAGRREIPAPVLSDLDVERTLWTIQGPTGLPPGEPELAGAEIGPLRQEMFRMKAATELLNLPTYVRAENTPEEIDRWFVSWERLWRAAYQRASQTRFLPGQMDHFDAAAFELLDTEQADVAIGLGTSRIRSDVTSEAVLPGSPDQLVAVGRTTLGSLTHCMLQGPSGRLTLLYPNRIDSEQNARLVASLTVVLLTIFIWLVVVRRRLPAPPRWPQWAGVLAGLAWWLWLTPSILGWGVVLVSLISLWRQSFGSQADHSLMAGPALVTGERSSHSPIRPK